MTQSNEPSQYGRQPGYGAGPEDRTQAYGAQPPAYGSQQYGGQQYGGAHYSAQPGFQARLEQSESFGIAGTVMALLGGILVLVGFTAVDWFSTADSSFSDIHTLLSDRSGVNGFADAYFAWLGWVFLVVAVIAGVLSAVPSPALRIFRIIGIVVGLAAAGLTFLALNFGDGSQYSELIKHARLGFYFAVVGFLIAGIGAGIGPRKV